MLLSPCLILLVQGSLTTKGGFLDGNPPSIEKLRFEQQTLLIGPQPLLFPHHSVRREVSLLPRHDGWRGVSVLERYVCGERRLRGYQPHDGGPLRDGVLRPSRGAPLPRGDAALPLLTLFAPRFLQNCPSVPHAISRLLRHCVGLVKLRAGQPRTFYRGLQNIVTAPT